LRGHLELMRSISPPESTHALDLDSLRAPGITFWTLWDNGGGGDDLWGCGALSEIGPGHGEIKSMHTARAHRGKGVAAHLVTHMLSVARSRSYARLSLETGSMVEFEPARALYARFGFADCPPFGSYIKDPNSVFMTLSMDKASSI